MEVRADRSDQVDVAEECVVQAFLEPLERLGDWAPNNLEGWLLGLGPLSALPVPGQVAPSAWKELNYGPPA